MVPPTSAVEAKPVIEELKTRAVKLAPAVPPTQASTRLSRSDASWNSTSAGTGRQNPCDLGVDRISARRRPNSHGSALVGPLRMNSLQPF
jgi:hypothetical protein